MAKFTTMPRLLRSKGIEMKPAFARLMMLATALAIGLGFWPARARLEGIVRPRFAQSYQRQLAKLSDRQAALFIQRLARSDNPLVEVLVTASADDRPVVAAASATQLRELVDRWAAL